MQLKIENIKISQVIQILDKLPLKGLKSIHRTRLSQQLTEKLERVIEEEKQIRKELCNLDEYGEPRVKDNGDLDVKDVKEFNKTMNSFFKERIVIDGGDSQVAMKSVKQSLEDSEIEWDTEQAYNFAYLYDAFIGKEVEDSE